MNFWPALNMFAATRKPITDIFTPKATDIDRSKCRRIVPMQVLALSQCRTGTSSVRLALKRLGYIDTYHMDNPMVENPPDCRMWRRAIAAKYEGQGEFGLKQWDQLLGHCQAVIDWPACIFSEELIAAYPDAKVIITIRDVDSWYSSMMKTIYWRVNDPWFKLASYLDWSASLYYPMLRDLFDKFFEGEFVERGKDIYLQHYENVRRIVPKEQLLEYKIREGWGPLCEFLGKPNPEEDFPRINDKDSFRENASRRTRYLILNGLFRILVQVLLVVVALNLLRFYK